MFSLFQRFRAVFVVGPHRSGSTFVAHAIAHDLGRVVIDEAAFHYMRIREIPALIARPDPFILHCPYLLPWAPIFDGSGCAFVFTVRDPEAIARSIRRSKTRSGAAISIPHFTAAQAAALWAKIRFQVQAPFEVIYEHLSSHPLYTPDHARAGWHSKQVCPSGTHHLSLQYPPILKK